MKCSQLSNCSLNLKLRKKCSACRLKKCYSEGMVPLEKLDNKNKEIESLLNSFLNSTITESFYKIEQIETKNDNYEHQNKLFKKRFARKLNQFEQMKIAEVQTAMSVFVDEKTASHIRHAKSTIEFVNIPEIYFKWICSFCKTIPAYNQLSDHDQLIVFKSFCFEILAIRFSVNFQKQEKGFAIFSVSIFSKI